MTEGERKRKIPKRHSEDEDFYLTTSTENDEEQSYDVALSARELQRLQDTSADARDSLGLAVIQC